MLAWCLAVVLVLYAAACAGLFLLQRSLLYFPQPRLLGTRLAAPFERADALLQLTVRPHAGPGAVLYFGGNAEDVSASVAPLAEAFPDREIVLLHYRGYGGSTGRPSEAAIAGDAAALFDRVHAGHPDVVVVGRSLGTGVALRLASTRPVAALVLVTPYDSLLEIAASRFPMFPVRWLLVDRYESWRYVARVAAPVLILAAAHDEVIPAASTARLHARFPAGQSRLVTFADASHNTISEEPGYVAALASVAAPGR